MLELSKISISLIVCLISALVSFIVARYQVKFTLEKVKLEYKQKATEQLFLKRFEIYPQLHSYLIKVIIRVKSDKLTITQLQEMTQYLIDWEIVNSIYVSEFGLKKINRATKLFYQIIDNQDVNTAKLSNESTKSVIKELYSIVMFLKTELGVLETEDFHNPTQAPKYTEITHIK